MREDYESGVASRDAWLLGKSDAVRDLYWFRRFKRGLIAALRTVYATDKATFRRWSTDGGRLPFPGWEESKKDTTCWRVWEAVDQTPREVSYVEWIATLDCLNAPRTLALRLALTDSLAFDFSHLSVVDGDDKPFRAAVEAPTVAQPPLFPAVKTLEIRDCGNDETLRRLKCLPNLQTLTLYGLSDVADAGLSSLSSCANLRSLEIWNCDKASEAGVAALRKRLPNCEIRFTPKN